MTTWVDSHCHLTLSRDVPARLLERAAAAGVAWLLCPGVDADSSEKSLRLAEEHPGVVLAASGLHPHEARHWPEQAERIAELASRSAAVGECGLDFFRDRSPRADQVAALRAQLALAVDLGKPVVVHCRDAFPDLHAEIERAGCGPKVVVHCWSGDPIWTRRFAGLGVTFSFAGNLAYASAVMLRAAAGGVPSTRTMVETDTPFLTPPPHRNDPNEPANVVAVGKALAAVWGIGLEEVARQTTATATKVFRGD